MEKGFYLYCIRPQTNDTIEVTKTISGEEKIQIVPYMELEAVISEVSLEEFGSEEIQKKAVEDLDWIKGKALIHEQVVEQAMRNNKSGIIPVIPMQFGVIFKTKEKLQETLYNNLEKFRTSLDFLSEKQEWGVKTFLDQKVFEKYLENGNAELLARKKEAELLPKGLAFFAKKQTAAKIDEIKVKELDRITDVIYTGLSQLAVCISKAKVLDREFTRMDEEMILNCFYLVEELKLKEFKEKTEELKKEFICFGIEVEISGPWPCYHFA